ncbi:MAG: DUF4919 domain-containing protein [Bacteroidales bacterium]|nr:DUF4919 domain-containing protein [Bacteroidales bacterium]MBD5282094.1 DUF4919 domain-containing protein [Bacteroides sp.]MDE6033945.1 DUF4919 domain-containing protein [Muribaculaceae bacterium]MBD5293596.1 DUF4919 domain-containing protein [Bacteroides sp.]MBD5351204.1 DUF4919 domain-containing protein [Bacteroides sp.]
MKRFLPFCLLLGLILCSFTEPQRPDMEQIRREVTDPASKYYYPKLMALYEQNETIMNLDDYRRLYLGYIFEEDFDPYRHTQYSSLVEDLYFKSRHSKGECDNIIKYAELSLKDNPFDLQQIDYLIYALREKGKNNLANIWQYRLNHILEAIVSTGTGVTPDNAWFVTNPQHEYFLLNRLGRVVTGYEFLQPGIDHISVAPKSEKDSVNYYFNSQNFLREYFRKFPAGEEE